jgi:hypothetical protein
MADAVTKKFAQEKFTALVNAMMLEDTRLDQDLRQGVIHACESMGYSNNESFSQSHLNSDRSKKVLQISFISSLTFVRIENVP